jgi:hypothetical protein
MRPPPRPRLFFLTHWALIRSTTGATFATVLTACANGTTWVQKTFGVSAYAGQSVQLYFMVRSTLARMDPTTMLLDDVAVS